ncbi:MAG: YidC/Oxa1 family membrane protein insertase [Clostridia bacterium]|nr:YidC/Oxa1 family membrane protein insertase [Clostridia bacterium]
MRLFSFISVPMGWVLKQISLLFNGNFALAVLVFTLLVNALLIPLSVKSQKASVQQARIKPKMDALKKKYGSDPKRYNEEVQKLYAEEKVSMSGGCLPLIIRLALMMGVYYAIYSPLQYVLNVDTDIINQAIEAAKSAGITLAQGREQITLIGLIQGGNEVLGKIISPDVVSAVDFNLFGINLTDTPQFGLSLSAIQLNWIIPFAAFAAAMLSSIISLAMQKKTNPDAPNMAFMMLSMPILSLVIAFSMPCAVGFYWACSSLISGLIQAGVQKWYGPNVLIAKAQINETYERFEKERKKLSNTANN